MARSRQTAPPYRWGTLKPLPWPKSYPFKIAKAQIQNHAIEISKLPYQDIKTQRDMYAAEFVSNNKDCIPQNRQAWTISCISRMMSCKIRDTRRNRRDGRTTPSASQETQDSSVANEPSDNNQPTPPRVLPNNNHRDNNHGVSNHGDNNYGDSNYEDNDRTHNETIATTDNVPCYTRSTRAVSLDLDDAEYHTEAPTVDDKFDPSALKQYPIRLNRLVNGNLQTTKRVLLGFVATEHQHDPHSSTLAT